MCFFVHGKVVEKTATEDIVVWKVINKNNKSNVYDFQYIPNTLCRLKKKLVVIHEFKINNGFHSYIRHPGQRYDSNSRNKFVKMIIPKGAKYYENSNERVSTSIRTLDLKHIPYTCREAKS